MGSVAADERDHSRAACRWFRLAGRAARSPPTWQGQRTKPASYGRGPRSDPAQVVLQAIGGSTNGLIHLTAMPTATRHRIDPSEAFDKLGERAVMIGTETLRRAYMEHFNHAGACRN